MCSQYKFLVFLFVDHGKQTLVQQSLVPLVYFSVSNCIGSHDLNTEMHTQRQMMTDKTQKALVKVLLL